MPIRPCAPRSSPAKPVLPTRPGRPVVAAGEACPPAGGGGGGRGGGMINASGPTERPVGASAAPGGEGEPPSTGRPTAGPRLYVLDAGRNPVLIGVAGELYL